MSNPAAVAARRARAVSASARCVRLAPVLVAAAAVVCGVAGAWRAVRFRANPCAMTYSVPVFEQVSMCVPGAANCSDAIGAGAHPARLASRYALYRYVGREPGTLRRAARAARHHVLFVPGHQGSHRQVRSLAAGVTAAAPPGSVAAWTLELGEESTAVAGHLMAAQAEFLNDAARAIVAESRAGAGVTVVAHSLGGVVARAALLLPGHAPGSVGTILTLGTPHAAAPVAVDPATTGAVARVAAGWVAGGGAVAEAALLSLSSGEADTQVWEDVARVGVPLAAFDAAAPRRGCAAEAWVATTDLRRVGVEVDHAALLWCGQLVSALGDALAALADECPPAAACDAGARLAVLQRALAPSAPATPAAAGSDGAARVAVAARAAVAAIAARAAYALVGVGCSASAGCSTWLGLAAGAPIRFGAALLPLAAAILLLMAAADGARARAGARGDADVTGPADGEPPSAPLRGGGGGDGGTGVAELLRLAHPCAHLPLLAVPLRLAADATGLPRGAARAAALAAAAVAALAAWPAGTPRPGVLLALYVVADAAVVGLVVAGWAAAAAVAVARRRVGRAAAVTTALLMPPAPATAHVKASPPRLRRRPRVALLVAAAAAATVAVVAAAAAAAVHAGLVHRDVEYNGRVLAALRERGAARQLPGEPWPGSAAAAAAAATADASGGGAAPAYHYRVAPDPSMSSAPGGGPLSGGAAAEGAAPSAPEPPFRSPPLRAAVAAAANTWWSPAAAGSAASADSTDAAPAGGATAAAALAATVTRWASTSVRAAALCAIVALVVAAGATVSAALLAGGSRDDGDTGGSSNAGGGGAVVVDVQRLLAALFVSLALLTFVGTAAHLASLLAEPGAAAAPGAAGVAASALARAAPLALLALAAACAPPALAAPTGPDGGPATASADAAPRAPAGAAAASVCRALVRAYRNAAGRPRAAAVGAAAALAAPPRATAALGADAAHAACAHCVHEDGGAAAVYVATATGAGARLVGRGVWLGPTFRVVACDCWPRIARARAATAAAAARGGRAPPPAAPVEPCDFCACTCARCGGDVDAAAAATARLRDAAERGRDAIDDGWSFAASTRFARAVAGVAEPALLATAAAVLLATALVDASRLQAQAAAVAAAVLAGRWLACADGSA